MRRSRVRFSLVAQFFWPKPGRKRGTTLPTALRGSSSTKCTSRGTEWSARCERTQSRTASAARDGLDVQVIVFNDYQLPNAALAAGDLVVHDALIHASAHDGMRAGRAVARS